MDKLTLMRLENTVNHGTVWPHQRDIQGHLAQRMGGAGQTGVIGANGHFNVVEQAFRELTPIQVVARHGAHRFVHGLVVVGSRNNQVAARDQVIVTHVIVVNQGAMPATARPTQAHSHAGGPAGAKPKLYNPRHPERTLLYQTLAEHFETWFELASAGQFEGQGDHHTPKPYVRQAFRKYLECGIFAHGFARAWCDDCGHDYFVAYSCKGRGVCPSCNTRRMVETAAHLTYHVFPRLPVRQWVLSVPKRLRYFMQRDEAVLGMVLRIFLRYCARPPFAMERLRKEGAALVYRCAKQHSEPGSDKRGAKADELTLTPLELIERIAALVPPPRPISGFTLHSEEYVRVGRILAGLGLPTVFVFEGGYAVAEVGVNAVNVLEGFLAS